MALLRWYTRYKYARVLFLFWVHKYIFDPFLVSKACNEKNAYLLLAMNLTFENACGYDIQFEKINLLQTTA